jgi:hypothetical protein
MAGLVNRAIDAAMVMLDGEAGLKVCVESLLELQGREVREVGFVLERANWSGKTTERTPESRLPRVSVGLKKLTGNCAEKFSRKAAKATVLIEIQVSGERPAAVGMEVVDFVDSLISLLDRSKGLWASGTFFAGEYSVELKPLQKGGLNFVQAAQFEIELYVWQD